jgi:3-dehydroquinate synthase
MIPELFIENKKIDLASYTKVVAIVDKELYKWHKAFLDKHFKDIIFIRSKETMKNIDEVIPILKSLADKNLDRNSCLVAIGGGVIGDITGFMASIYMRGIDFIQIPTTYMAMCDHIIGKVAISNVKKNVFGSFYSPKRTYIFKRFIKILPQKLINQGFAEVLKHYFITGNKELKKIILKKKVGIKDLINAVEISHKIKSSFVKKDPRDINGSHKALSYGHTFANAIEKIDQNINHGEAVLKGMILATKLSHKLGLLNDKDFIELMKICTILERKFDVQIKIKKKNINNMLHSFKTDKISCNGKMKFVLLTKVGKHVIVEIEEKQVKNLLLGECENDA